MNEANDNQCKYVLRNGKNKGTRCVNKVSKKDTSGCFCCAHIPRVKVDIKELHSPKSPEVNQSPKEDQTKEEVKEEVKDDQPKEEVKEEVKEEMKEYRLYIQELIEKISNNLANAKTEHEKLVTEIQTALDDSYDTYLSIVNGCDKLKILKRLLKSNCDSILTKMLILDGYSSSVEKSTTDWDYQKQVRYTTYDLEGIIIDKMNELKNKKHKLIQSYMDKQKEMEGC